MAVFKFKRKVLCVALKRAEDDKGIDYIAAGATALAMLTKNGQVEITDETIERELDGLTLGHDPAMLVGAQFKFTGSIEIQGSGTATTAVAYSALLQAAGRDEDTTTVATEVSYNVIEDNTELDATAYFEIDGHLYSGLGCRATFKTSIKVGELPYLDFELTGVFGDLIDGNVPNSIFTAFKKPIKVSKTNTSFTLDGTARALVEYECNQGNSLELLETTESESVEITDIKSDGKFVVEAPALSEFDPNAMAESEVQVPYAITHGIAAGSIYQEEAELIQILRPKAVELKGGIRGWEIPFRIIGTNKIVTK